MIVCIFVNDEQNFPKEKMLKICVWSAMSLYFKEGHICMIKEIILNKCSYHVTRAYGVFKNYT